MHKPNPDQAALIRHPETAHHLNRVVVAGPDEDPLLTEAAGHLGRGHTFDVEGERRRPSLRD